MPAPTITGTVSGQTTTSQTPIDPFSGVTISDANAGATDTLSIKLSGPGSLSGTGLSGSDGSYTLTGTTAAITSELRALSFTSVNGVPNTSVTTTFTLSDTSSAYGMSAYDPPLTMASFSGANGVAPVSNPVSDAAGDLFGVTSGGGADNDGTVFEIAKSTGALTTLASFTGANGDDPWGVTSDAAGDLFGTTAYGGAHGDGTVFEIAKSTGELTTLASFTGDNGENPFGTVISDAAGDLFGTTAHGTADGYGTVFEIAKSTGELTTLATFTGANGATPAGGLTIDAEGDLFGTTANGGIGGADGDGTVFEIAKSTGELTTLANFTGSNGEYPERGLTIDAAGDLFGTTFHGGADNDGTVFEVVKSTGALITLATFTGANGANPLSGLVSDAAGDLFGTTEVGGADNGGTAFEIAKSTGLLTTLATFTGVNGEELNGGLTINSAGDLFGTTYYGGANEDGTVFELPATFVAAPTVDNTTTVTVVTDSDPKVAPTITGTVASRATTLETPIDPFSGVTIGDTNAAATDTLSITLSGPGSLSGTGLSGSGGSYTLTGTAAAITSKLRALSFKPVDGVPNTSATTTFTLSDTSSAGLAAVNKTTVVTDSDPKVAPTITGTVASRATTLETPIDPFSGVTIGDTNAAATDTLSITLSGPGSLSGTGLSGSGGSYTLTGTAAAITSKLRALSFKPVDGVPNTSATTTFTLSDTSSAGLAAVNKTTVVTDSDPKVAPTITGTVASRATTLETPIDPFSGVTIGDTNAAATDTLSITLSGPGSLSGTGLSGSGGSYTLTGTAAAITSKLRALSFKPVDGVPNTSATTTFTLSDTSSAGLAAVNKTTVVTDSDPKVAPTITGTVASRATTLETPIDPFSGVTIGDTNAAATDTLSITLSGPGSLSGTGLSGSGGSYTLTGTAAAITSKLRALSFKPVDGVPNTSATTTFTLSDTSSAGLAAVNKTTVVTDSDPKVAPTITGGASISTVAGAAAMALDPGLSIRDPDPSTLAGATIRISAGLLSGDTLTVGSPQAGVTSSYNASTGLLTLSGQASLSTYQTELDSLTFASATSSNPSSRTITWSVTDGVDPPAQATSSVAVFVSNPDLDISLQGTSGHLALWQASGSTTPTLSAAALLGADPGSSWLEVGTGSFFGGGASDASDILLQNTNGSVAAWQMQGAALLSGDVVANLGPSWRVDGVGDFNGDGKTDIALQNNNGNVAIWEMSGGQISQSGVVANPGPSWHVEGTGDFNQDGKSDIVLQNNSGAVAVWEINGNGQISHSIGVANPGPSWHVVETGADLYGDGKSDIVLQNNSGAVAVWEINGSGQISQSGMIANPGPSWRVEGAGDFNSDGKTDLVLQSNSGAVAVWDMNGSTISQSGVLANPGPTWSVVGRHIG